MVPEGGLEPPLPKERDFESRASADSATPALGSRSVARPQLTGNAPVVLVTLTTAEGRSVDLTGDLRGELRNLTGAEVAVRGRLASARDFQVMSYEIRAIDGQQPLVGTVAYRDGEYWLDADESVRLVNASEGLRAQVGAKVWILGRAMVDGVYPQTYGVIRASRE